MTNCKDKCWCKKFPIKEPSDDDSPLIRDLYCMAHKIEHLYDGIEKCFERIEKLDALVSTIGVNFVFKDQLEIFVEENVKNIHARIDGLYETDHDERITDLENSQIEKRLSSLEVYMNMEDRVTASDILQRIYRLEEILIRGKND